MHDPPHRPQPATKTAQLGHLPDLREGALAAAPRSTAYPSPGSRVDGRYEVLRVLAGGGSVAVGPTWEAATAGHPPPPTISAPSSRPGAV